MSIESARTVTLGTFENNNMVTPISTINNNEQMSSELLDNQISIGKFPRSLYVGNITLYLSSILSVVNEGNQRITSQLETLQSHIFEIQEQSANEINEKDNYIKKLQNDLDRSESEREELEVVAMELKSAKEVSLNRIKHFEMETELLRNEKETLKIEKNNESESLANLQAVLEEFEAAKQSEIKEAVEGMQRRLSTTSKELAEYKDRALLAENQLRQIKQELMANMLQWSEEQKEKVGLIRKASINRPIEDRSSGWVSGLWTPTLERPRSRLSEDVPRPTIRISEDEEDGPKEVLI
ncbi:6535_t:CDS:2 [Entrophospora sp. SA101]|nr:6535_t:CDS:2 [Entrophospora sp. SA101]